MQRARPWRRFLCGPMAPKASVSLCADAHGPRLAVEHHDAIVEEIPSEEGQFTVDRDNAEFLADLAQRNGDRAALQLLGVPEDRNQRDV